MTRENKVLIVGGIVAAVALIGVAARSSETGDVSRRDSEATVVTNENGSVSRLFTECTVSTNGSMVTERRRETRTTLDTEGNMLATSTSEYAQSYSVGDVGMAPLSGAVAADRVADGEEKPAADSFLGLKFGEEFAGTNLVTDAAEPTLLRATFVPKKPLAGFDDYYVYVTPKTHRVVKVYACAREAVESGTRWRHHYLVEALEKRYHGWARLCSWQRPCYAIEMDAGRYVTVCLAGASRDYETVVAAWDDALLTAAADETEELRRAARKSAAEKRNRRVEEAAAAF